MKYTSANDYYSQKLPIKVDHPYGLSILDDVIFWTELQRGLVRIYNYNTHEERTLAAENHPLYDIKVFSSLAQNREY